MLHVSPAAALSTLRGSSSLIGSRWQLKLDIGLEPGSYLARSDWGASGGRLRFNVDVDFEDTPSTVSEELVGPLSGTLGLGLGLGLRLGLGLGLGLGLEQG